MAQTGSCTSGQACSQARNIGFCINPGGKGSAEDTGLTDATGACGAWQALSSSNRARIFMVTPMLILAGSICRFQQQMDQEYHFCIDKVYIICDYRQRHDLHQQQPHGRSQGPRQRSHTTRQTVTPPACAQPSVWLLCRCRYRAAFEPPSCACPRLAWPYLPARHRGTWRPALTLVFVFVLVLVFASASIKPAIRARQQHARQPRSRHVEACFLHVHAIVS